MTTEAFSIGEAIDFGWTKAKDHFWLLIGAAFCQMILPVLPVFIVSHLPGMSGNDIGILGAALNTVAGIMQIILQVGLMLGMVKISLKICDNQQAQFADLFSCFPLFFNCLFAYLFYTVMVAIGAIFFIVPGIILAIQFYFFFYAIVDKELGPIACLKASYAITKGEKWHLFLFALSMLLIVLLGALCLGIGVLVSIAIVLPATAHVFRKLQTAAEVPLIAVPQP